MQCALRFKEDRVFIPYSHISKDYLQQCSFQTGGKKLSTSTAQEGHIPYSIFLVSMVVCLLELTELELYGIEFNFSKTTRSFQTLAWQIKVKDISNSS